MKLFAVIPAAGLSRRMGRSKLTMPLLGEPVIQRLMRTLDRADVTRTVVVLRRDDEELAALLRSAPGSDRIELVQPESDPPDMRTSVTLAVQALRSKHSPSPTDGWLLIPADHPVLDPQVLDQLIAAWRLSTADILLPTFGNERGHPVFMRWSLTGELPRIPPDSGLNWLRQLPGVRVQTLEVASESVLFDMDTPEDFTRIEAWLRDRQRSSE